MIQENTLKVRFIALVIYESLSWRCLCRKKRILENIYDIITDELQTQCEPSQPKILRQIFTQRVASGSFWKSWRITLMYFW